MTAIDGFDGFARVMGMGSDGMSMTMSRRRVLRLGGSVGAAAITGLLLKSLPVSAAASNGGHTLTNLNLRSKPSSSGNVLAVMPFGSLVTDFGSGKNGYVQCTYQGIKGWAYQEFLISTNPDSWPYMSSNGVTTKKARVRQYPVGEADILATAPKGAKIQLADKVVDGYRFVTYGSTEGWMLDSAIGNVTDGIQPGDRLVTTANVNAREQSNTSSKVMKVLPEGTEVVAVGFIENGFADVSFDGGGGWVYMDYLAKL